MENSIENEIKEVAEKLASFGKAELEKLASILFNDLGSATGVHVDGNPIPPGSTSPPPPKP